MRCAVSFLAVIILSIAVGLMALYIIWITENEDNCQHFRCLQNGKCIKPKLFCNRAWDCPDGSDEQPFVCNDMSTTSIMLDIMVECRTSTLELDDDNNTAVNEKPEECIYLGINQSTGIKCHGVWMNRSFSQIPWNEFDRFSRTISIDNGALNTSLLLGQSEPKNEELWEFPYLYKLYIDHNHIVSVGEKAFCRMENVCWFSLRENEIRNLSRDAFCPMMRLRMLKMGENKLHLNGFQFKNMSLLQILHLDHNEINEITNLTFSQLENLTMLNISHNKIKFIHKDAFQRNTNLIELDLTSNLLTHLPSQVFKANVNLTKLYISSNPFHHLQAELFSPLSNLRSLNIETFDISVIDLNAFNYTKTLDIVYFKKFSYCQFVPRAQRCYPHSDGLSSTSNLLIGQSRIIVWIVGLLTVLGNISVLTNRWCRRRSMGRAEITAILNIFVTNLAVADLLMGVYLIILACKDVQFRGLYSAKAYEWGTSWLCSCIGITAMISSEVSLLILTLMSLERYLTIGGPFAQGRNLSPKLARASMLIIWGFVCTLALAPAIQWQGETTAFYGSTGLCFPIHLDERYPVGWQYTTFVFLGVNSCCLVLITISYSMLFRTVQKTQDSTPLMVKNVELAFRFFLMVITDVLCWAPIIILKTAVLCGYDLSKEIIGWVVIYILPLNSAVNPLLYTFSTNEVRHTMRSHISRLFENFELGQLLPSQNRAANIMELQGITRTWLNRLVPRRREAAQRDVPPVVVTAEDTELTHSICPTIMTTDNSYVIGATGGADSAQSNYTLNNSNYNNASVKCGLPPEKILVAGADSSSNLNLKNVKCYNNRLSPSSLSTTSPNKLNDLNK